MKKKSLLVVLFLIVSCSTDDSEVNTNEASTLQPTENSSSNSSTDSSGTSTDSSDTSTGSSDSSTGISNDISVLVEKFYYDSAVSVVVNGDNLVIYAKDLPDHKSAYYDLNNDLYEAYDEPDNPSFKLNPNDIAEQNIVMTIPRFPEKANNHESTPMGTMGVAVNSGSIFNQMAAPGDDILEELNTFDQYEGHPAPGGVYHYHIEPVWLTETLGEDAFIGLLLDGFPVYGPVEDGVRLTNDDLDVYHGHSHETTEFPNGIYHYHITDDLPWINGDGFYGTPGTITN